MLAQDQDARLIAGGQSLVPLMAMRLARPKRLIDIARLAELAFIRAEGDTIAIGATTRQSQIERDALVHAGLPLLAKVMPFVGHAAIRTRGTLGGSLANADPAAELALVAVTLGATIQYRHGDSRAEMRATQFFAGPMTSALPPAGCLTGVRFPVWREAGLGTGFGEISARRSDFAFASAAAQIALDEDGLCRRAAVGLGAVSTVPRRLDALEQMLKNTRLDEDRLREAIAAALTGIDMLSDLHASADYRRRAAAALLLRAISEAWAGAAGQA
jgi:CO/xanthine dehydrogenase FAD-binding subunit